MATMDPVVHFEMPYSDRDRLASFYSSVFGWNLQALGEDMGYYVTAETAETDEQHMLKRPGAINGGFYPKVPERQYPSVVIAVDDLSDRTQRVVEAGGKLVGEPTEIPGIGRFVSMVDTEGNQVGLLQPRNR